MNVYVSPDRINCAYFAHLMPNERSYTFISDVYNSLYIRFGLVLFYHIAQRHYRERTREKEREKMPQTRETQTIGLRNGFYTKSLPFLPTTIRNHCTM